MKRNRPDATEPEPHVFDQTNGLVDRGADTSERSDSERDRGRNQVVGGIAMLSANRPAG